MSKVFFKRIAKELRGLNLIDSEEEYFNEFLNILFRDGILSYDSIEHDTFIKSNRDYIKSLEMKRIQGGQRFVIIIHLHEMYNELRALNKNNEQTIKNSTLNMIEEYESISGCEKPISSERKAVFLVDKRLKNKREIIVCEMDANKTGEQYSPYQDTTLHREVVNTFRRPKAYLRALERGFEAFNSIS